MLSFCLFFALNILFFLYYLPFISFFNENHLNNLIYFITLMGFLIVSFKLLLLSFPPFFSLFTPSPSPSPPALSLLLFLLSLPPIPFPLSFPHPLWLLSACSLFPCLWLYFACLFVLLIRFHL